MNQVFDTAFENMLRELVLLDAIPEPTNIDKIAALDFLCIYGKSCSVLANNLHGDNRFNFAELSKKHDMAKQAIATAIRCNFIMPLMTPYGMHYELTDRGKQEVKTINESFYAKEYRAGLISIVKKFWSYSDTQLLAFINAKANESEGGSYAELLN